MEETMNRFYRYAQGFKEKHKHNGERIGRYKNQVRYFTN